MCIRSMRVANIAGCLGFAFALVACGSSEDGSSSGSKSAAPEEAVFVYLDGTGLPQDVYDNHDLATLEDQLIQVIEARGLGTFDGNEFGPDEVVLYMYGPSAEALYAGIREILENYPLCQNGRVVIRSGGPGSAERTVEIGSS